MAQGTETFRIQCANEACQKVTFVAARSAEFIIDLVGNPQKPKRMFFCSGRCKAGFIRAESAKKTLPVAPAAIIDHESEAFQTLTERD